MHDGKNSAPLCFCLRRSVIDTPQSKHAPTLSLLSPAAAAAPASGRCPAASSDSRGRLGDAVAARPFATAATAPPRHSPQRERQLTCTQKADPPHSRQRSRRLPCVQMDAPPHSRQRERCLPCVQRGVPPHSPQRERCLPCAAQMDDPTHSLHRERCLPCVQKDDPPHSRHREHRLLCVQRDTPPHSRHREHRLPCEHLGLGMPPVVLPESCSATSSRCDSGECYFPRIYLHIYIPGVRSARIKLATRSPKFHFHGMGRSRPQHRRSNN